MSTVIEIKENVQIGNIILEAGDKIQVLEKSPTNASITVNITYDKENDLDEILSIAEKKYKLKTKIKNMNTAEVMLSGEFTELYDWFINEYEGDIKVFLKNVKTN